MKQNLKHNTTGIRVLKDHWWFVLQKHLELAIVRENKKATF